MFYIRHVVVLAYSTFPGGRTHRDGPTSGHAVAVSGVIRHHRRPRCRQQQAGQQLQVADIVESHVRSRSLLAQVQSKHCQPNFKIASHAPSQHWDLCESVKGSVLVVMQRGKVLILWVSRGAAA